MLATIIFATMAVPSVGRAQVSPGGGGVITVTTVDRISPDYTFYGVGQDKVTVNVNASTLTFNENESIQVVSSFRPSQISISVVQGGRTVELQPVVSSGHFGSSYEIDFVTPQNSTDLQMVVKGNVAGTGFLWRYITSVPSISVGGFFVNTVYNTELVLQNGNLVTGLYTFAGQSVSSGAIGQPVYSGDQVYFAVNPNVNHLIVESDLYVPAALALTIIGGAAIVIVALGYLSRGRALIARAFTFTRGSILRKITLPYNPRALFRPKTLAVLFLLCAFLMIGIGATGGPDPRVKAYVIADPSAVSAIHSGLASAAGSVSVVTPSEDYTDFGTMSSVGMFQIAVISNYPPLALPPISQGVLGSLGNVPVIVVDRSADQNFVQEIRLLYGSHIVSIPNAAAMTQNDTQAIASRLVGVQRTNFLGLQLGSSSFTLVLIAEGLLSFALVFIGWAYLGSLVSDSGSHSTLSHLAYVVVAGVFVFMFSEAVYIETSSLLAFPLSLHAVISGAKEVTAVGYLGFGGGSTPRLAAGVLGVVSGVVAAEGRPPLHKEDFALLLGIPLVLLADPFFVGNYAYEAILLFVGNYSFGTAFTSSLSLKGFIYGVGGALGGGASPAYLMSAGKMLYFAGLPPIAYLRRFGRTTMTLVVLASAVVLGDGGVRVGEMTPAKTFISVVPGLAIGLAFLGLFLAISEIEKYIRGMKR